MNIRVADLGHTQSSPFKHMNIACRAALCAALTIVGILVVAQPASAAAVLLVNADGELTGANGVNVAGTLYDVRFTDESCATVYDGCDEVSDFAFNTLSASYAASQALLDQVFIDGPSGLFDTVPGLTVGCLATNTVCYALTPYGFEEVPPGAYFLAAGAVNRSAGDQTNNNALYRDTDFPRMNQGFATGFSFILADWTPAAAETSPVPEPASMLLLGTGLAGAGVRRWRQRRA